MIIYTTRTGIQIGINYAPPGPTMDADAYRLKKALTARRGVLRLGRLRITADRWPWQACVPHWSHVGKTPKRYGWGLVPGMARFGGGWDWKLGLSISTSTVIVDLLFGSIRICLKSKESA